MIHSVGFRVRVLAVLASSLGLASLRGASPVAPAVSTPQDLWSVKRPADLQLSPDGARLVFTVQEFNLEKNSSQKHLWLLDAADGKPRPLTSAESSDNGPAWSADGTRIAFASKRAGDEQPSLYVIR